MQEREIILDTETTGLSPKAGHRLIEIGALEMENKVLTGKRFHRYINPERDVPKEAYMVHGISSQFLSDKPVFSLVADEFLEFVGSGVLVIHNARFDIGFLNHELSMLKKTSLALEDAIDTLKIARNLFPASRVSLDALCKRFKVNNSSRKFHGALKDALLLAEVYVELCGGRQTGFSLKSSVVESGGAGIEDQALDAKTTTMVVLPSSEEKQRHDDFLNKIRCNQ